jgi:hypothetical protein
VAKIPDQGHHHRMIELGARSRRRWSRPNGRATTRTARATLVTLLLAATALAAPPPGAAESGARLHHEPAAQALAAWTGGVNLYRDGVFTTQSSWLYCTAADVQMIRNMIEGTEDHSGSAQTAYFDWMRTKNRYDLPLSAGVDPAGWTAGMRHFVNDRYRLVSTTSFGLSLQLAVERMRATNMPVALAVAHGNHGWILNGFTATADPAVTTEVDVTSVSVTGPLWGLQSRNGYDMPPNTTLTVDQLKTYFTRWHYDPLPMVWDGTFVSIQPLTDEELAAAAATPPPPTSPPPSPPPTSPPTPEPTPAPTPAPTPEPTQPAPPSPSPSATPPPEAAVGGAAPTSLATPVPDASAGTGSTSGLWPAVLLLLVAGLVVGGVLAARRRSTPSEPLR